MGDAEAAESSGPGVRGWEVVRWQSVDGQVTHERAPDVVAVEEPLEIRVRGRSIAVTMRTPGGVDEDAELAAGFLLTEGVVRERRDIERIEACVRVEDGSVLNVRLRWDAAFDVEALARNAYLSSSCGVCGKASIERVHQHFPALESEGLGGVSGDVLVRMPSLLRAAQPTFERTGGLHAAGLFGLDGGLEVSREDVGRHNAVDKVIGSAWLAGRVPLHDRVLMVSGRVSFEIVQKALAARIPIIAAVSAPTSLAVEFAAANQQTLIGFLREGRMNIYSRADRVIG